jgi:hypothetical protein
VVSLKCSDSAAVTLNKCKEVLSIVFETIDETEPELEQWRNILPIWFINQLSPELTQEEAEIRLKVPLKQRMKIQEEWTLSGWRYWFNPEKRQWLWWNAIIEDEKTIKVGIEVLDWPVPYGALRWLLKSAGAVEIKEIDCKSNKSNILFRFFSGLLK